MSETYRIGRNRNKVDIAILDQGCSISGVHLELTLINDNRAYITDLGSTNGTYRVSHGKKTLFLKGHISLDEVIFLGEFKTTGRRIVENIDTANAVPLNINEIVKEPTRQNDFRYVRNNVGEIQRVLSGKKE